MLIPDYSYDDYFPIPKALRDYNPKMATDYPLKFMVTDIEGKTKECKTTTGSNDQIKLAQKSLHRYLTSQKDARFVSGVFTSFNSSENWRYSLQFVFSVPVKNGDEYHPDGDHRMGICEEREVNAVWETVGNRRSRFTGFSSRPKLSGTAEHVAGLGWFIKGKARRPTSQYAPKVSVNSHASISSSAPSAAPTSMSMSSIFGQNQVPTGPRTTQGQSNAFSFGQTTQAGSSGTGLFGRAAGLSTTQKSFIGTQKPVSVKA